MRTVWKFANVFRDILTDPVRVSSRWHVSFSVYKSTQIQETMPHIKKQFFCLPQKFMAISNFKKIPIEIKDAYFSIEKSCSFKPFAMEAISAIFENLTVVINVRGPRQFPDFCVL